MGPNRDTLHRVLVVDDEAMISHTLTQIFNLSGYQARAVASAEDAIALIDSWQPDLAVIDIFLPRMNGIDLAIFLKARLPSCHLLLFSGQPESAAIVERAAEIGHRFEVMAKPVPPPLLLDRVASLFIPTSS